MLRDNYKIENFPSILDPQPTTSDVPPQPTTSDVQPQPTTTDVQPQPTTTDVQPQPTTTDVQPQPTTTDVPIAPSTTTDVIGIYRSNYPCNSDRSALWRMKYIYPVVYTNQKSWLLLSNYL